MFGHPNVGTTTTCYCPSWMVESYYIFIRHRQLQKVFRSQGLVKYGESGDKFDPHLHDAMFEYDDPAQEPGTVGQVENVFFRGGELELFYSFLFFEM